MNKRRRIAFRLEYRHREAMCWVPQSGKLVHPYRKWFKLQSGVYFYKTVTGAKKNCPIVFDWRVPPNAVSTLHNLRGVVYSRKGGMRLCCTLIVMTMSCGRCLPCDMPCAS